MLEDCQLRHGSTYELVVYVEARRDADGRWEACLVLDSGPGQPNRWHDGLHQDLHPTRHWSFEVTGK